MILEIHKMPNNKSKTKQQPNKPFYHYPLIWRDEPTKRIRFPSQVKYIEENIPEKVEENNVTKKGKKRGRPKKEPRKVVVEDDNIVKWIVENYHS